MFDKLFVGKIENRDVYCSILFNKYLITTLCILGTVLVVGDILVNEMYPLRTIIKFRI